MLHMPIGRPQRSRALLVLSSTDTCALLLYPAHVSHCLFLFAVFCIPSAEEQPIGNANLPARFLVCPGPYEPRGVQYRCARGNVTVFARNCSPRHAADSALINAWRRHAALQCSCAWAVYACCAMMLCYSLHEAFDHLKDFDNRCWGRYRKGNCS